MTRQRIPARLRRLVAHHAHNCCEYCLIPQEAVIYLYCIDHILAVKHGGRTIRENLAFACIYCNLRKGTDFATIDPTDDQIVMLFNPRTQLWRDHFAFDDAHLVGLTPTGRATIRLLGLNDDDRVRQRRELILKGIYPPLHIQLGGPE